MAHGRTRVPEIRKGDTVLVLSGKDAGKQGVVERVITNAAAIQRTSGRGADNAVQSRRGIIDIAKPLDISKVMLVCPSCKEPTRIRHTVLDDGRRVRVCTHCGKAIEVTA
jgi:large subunit ribosomal protein L24